MSKHSVSEDDDPLPSKERNTQVSTFPYLYDFSENVKQKVEHHKIVSSTHASISEINPHKNSNFSEIVSNKEDTLYETRTPTHDTFDQKSYSIESPQVSRRNKKATGMCIKRVKIMSDDEKSSDKIQEESIQKTKYTPACLPCTPIDSSDSRKPQKLSSPQQNLQGFFCYKHSLQNKTEIELLELCHDKKWHNALIFIQNYNLTLITRSSTQKRKFGEREMISSCFLYSLLSIACHVYDSSTNANLFMKALFESLSKKYFCSNSNINQKKKDIICSFDTFPIHEALKNTNVTSDLVQSLLKVDFDLGNCSSTTLSMSMKDSNGLSYLDKLVNMLYTHSFDNPSAKQRKLLTLEAIRGVVKFEPKLINVDQRGRSPLLHLLSQHFFDFSTSHEEFKNKHDSMSSLIASCAKIFLSADPYAITYCSIITGCTPLHLALRNGHGSNADLIQLLLEADKSGIQLKTRNHYGDLPIHIAAIIGASYETNKMLIHYTILSEKKPSFPLFDPLLEGSTSCIYSINRNGYSPIHLAWLHQVDGRRPYPANHATPLGDNPRIHSEYAHLYHDKLKSNIDRCFSLINSNGSSKIMNVLEREEVARSIFGSFWDFLILFLRGTYLNCVDQDEEKNEQFFFLHATLALPFFVNGLNMPRPLYDLALMVYPEQVYKTDAFDRLPLHYICASFFTANKLTLKINKCDLKEIPIIQQNLPKHTGWDESSYVVYDICVFGEEGVRKLTFPHVQAESNSEASTKKDDKSFLRTLLRLYPKATYQKDINRTLPLHLVIESEKKWKKYGFHENDNNMYLQINVCNINWTNAVMEVAKTNMRALDQCDPFYGCFPFLQAALESKNCLNSVYTLLRMSPSLIENCCSKYKY